MKHIDGRLLAVSLALSLAASPAELHAQVAPIPPDAPRTAPAEPSIEGTRVHVPGALAAPLDVGCAATAVFVDDDRLYVACGEEGVLVYALAPQTPPRLLERGRAGGRAIGFFRVGARVFVALEQTTARPFDELLLTAPALDPDGVGVEVPASRPDAPDRAAATGEVLSTDDRVFVVSLGALDGLVVGDHVAVRRAVHTDDLEGQRTLAEETLVVGRVVRTSEHRAAVELGMNERVPVGAVAAETAEPLSATRIAPPAARPRVELLATLRPFLPLEGLGLGVTGDLAAVFRYRSLMVRAELDTLGIGIGSTDQWLASGSAIVAYEHRLFAVGLGAGVMRHDEADVPVTAPYDTRFGAAFTVSQYARLGERDGLALSFTNHLALVDERECRTVDGVLVCTRNPEFRWAAVHADLQVPIAARTWLVARGGGGHDGMIHGEAGVRLLLRGNGGSGSLFATPLVGGASMRGRDGERNAGPSVALRLEWRP